MAEEADKDTVEVSPLADAGGLGRPVDSALVRVDLGALSHRGKVRANNEDHYLVARFQRTMQIVLNNLPAGELPEHGGDTMYGMVVADGMGGEAGGEVASRTAIRTMIDLVLQTPDWIMRLDEQLARQVGQRMAERFRQIREVLNELARADPKLFGMGTTMTLACSNGADLLTAHVGDSRAYLFRCGQLHQLTRDQTAAQAMVDAGTLRPEEAATHPLRNRLTGAISTRLGETQAEIAALPLANGDRLLLCTDGLTDMVAEETIAEVLQRIEAVADACGTLVELALERGGKDNVTVVLAHYHLPD